MDTYRLKDKVDLIKDRISKQINTDENFLECRLEKDKDGKMKYD